MIKLYLQNEKKAGQQKKRLIERNIENIFSLKLWKPNRYILSRLASTYSTLNENG